MVGMKDRSKRGRERRKRGREGWRGEEGEGRERERVSAGERGRPQIYNHYSKKIKKK
jgi:hypothetical protein